MELRRLALSIPTSLFGLLSARRGYLCCFFIFYCLSPTVAQPREQQTCPPRCRCMFVEGRLTADCSGARLSSIPGPFPAGAMIIRFDNNPIGEAKWLQQAQYFLRTDRFAADWIELSLRSCNISAFRPELFWGLTNLNKLILSRNKLTKIPTKPEPPAPDAQDTFTPFKDMAKLRVSASELFSSFGGSSLEHCPVFSLYFLYTL